MKPRILLLDIETAPNVGLVWGKYDQNVIKFKEHWYILCVAYKWLDNKKIYCPSLVDFKGYKKNLKNDFKVLQETHKTLDKADIVIGHNLDRFDIRRLNSRFVYHGFSPPSPYRTIDTLKVARKYFKFESNRLDDLGDFLKLGRKKSTGGFELWEKCMAGDTAAWKIMKKYAKQDVKLLENVYLKLRPWIANHPNLSVFSDDLVACPACNSTKVVKRGFAATQTQTYQQWNCKDCGKWSRSRLRDKTQEPPEIK